MPSSDSNTRLLYAILSQKCLKDIDWNKVASHPVIRQEITNGHAARMRYSRFKRQIEPSASSPRKPREPKPPASPRKSKVEKSKSKSRSGVKTEAKIDRRLKLETPEMTPDIVGGGSGNVKGERESEMPVTPEPDSQVALTLSYLESEDAGSQSQSQGSFGCGGGGGMGDVDHEMDGDDMLTSFGMTASAAGEHGMYAHAPMLSAGHAHGGGGAFGSGYSPMGMGMGMQMGLDEYADSMWEQVHMPDCEHVGASRSGCGSGSGSGVQVKKEERWDEAYRHI